MYKLSKKLSILLASLLALTTLFAILPLSGAIGNIHVNSTTAPSPAVIIRIGDDLSLYFGDVTWSGAQVDLYLSNDGYASLTIPGDILYSPTFNVADIKNAGVTFVNGYRVGYDWINGTIPETLGIPGGNYYIKAFDGLTSPVAVTDNYIRIVENIVYISTQFGPPYGWNPLLGSPAWGNNLQYESLFTYGTRDDVWIPWLAENYSWVNKHTLLVKIRDEASWWDVEPVTAHDVKYTYELGKKYAVSWSNVWDCLEGITVVDDKRVLFETSEDKVSYFRFLSLLYDVVIMPKHRWEVLEEEMGESVTQFLDNNPEEIVASGCYRLDEWSEDAWYYKKVEDWWGEYIFGSPDPQYVAQISYESNAEALSAFRQGECDAMAHFIPSVWELWEVEGLPIRTYYGDPPYYIGFGVVLLYVNYAFYPLDQLAVRRAVSYAIPYEDLISVAYFNYSVRASPSMVIDTVPAYAQYINDTLVETYGYELNLTRAAQILDDADIIDRDSDGVREMPDGTPLGPYTISVPYGWTDWMMMCDMISSNLQSIGIDCQTDFPDFSVWFDRLHRGMFDFVISWDERIGFDHPWNTFRFVMDPRLTGPVGEAYPSGNWERYMNEEVIPLIDAAAKERDTERLKEIYSDLQELGLTDLPAIPLFYGASWYEFSTAYWLGWPREEDPRWLSPWPWDLPNNVPVYFGLSNVSEGEKPMPSWVADLQIPTTKIYEDLAEAAIALTAFPLPFAKDGVVNSTVVIGTSDPHGPCGAAHTLDTVGGMGVTAVLGTCGCVADCRFYLDTDVAWYNETEWKVHYWPVEGLTNIITIGGPGVNMITWRYFCNPWYAPVYMYYDGGLGEWVVATPTETYVSSDWIGTDPLSDLVVLEVIYVEEEGRYVLWVGGFGGYATRAGCLILQLYDTGELPFTLEGKAMLIRWIDENGNAKVDPEDTWNLVETVL